MRPRILALALTCLALLALPTATAVGTDTVGTDAADASVPCPDGSLGRLFCAITEAVNEYCETEFGHPCLI